MENLKDHIGISFLKSCPFSRAYFLVFIVLACSCVFTVQHTIQKSMPPEAFFLYSLALFVRHPYLFLCLDCSAFTFCLYLLHPTQTSMPPVEFKPAAQTSDRPQTLALDSSATGIIEPGTFRLVAQCLNKLCYRVPPFRSGH